MKILSDTAFLPDFGLVLALPSVSSVFVSTLKSFELVKTKEGREMKRSRRSDEVMVTGAYQTNSNCHYTIKVTGRHYHNALCLSEH